MIGKTISHYKITGRLGEGGMGVVYKAKDLKLDRNIALKFLPSKYAEDKEKEERFIQEAKAASALDHPNICTIFEIDETDNGELFIAMGYYKGKTLKEKIKEGPLDINEALEITSQIAQGLDKAHSKGIIHRDIKPGNIIITDDGVVKILDFGLAKMAGIDMTTDGSTMGTVAYMSPEQATGGDVDHRSDIWSLGIIFYEMLTGCLPFRGDYPQALLYSIINNDPESLQNYIPDLPQDFSNTINRSLDKESEYRYQRMEDFLSEIKRLKRDSGKISSIQNSTTITIERRVKENQENKSIHESTTIILTPQKRKKLVVFAAGIVLLIIAITLFLSNKIQSKNSIQNEITDRSIAVMYFENRTERKDLENILVDLLITNLSRFEELEVVSSQRLFDLLKKTGKDKVKLIDREVATQVAKEANVKIMMLGSIIEIGDRIRINAQLSDVITGRNIGSEQVDGNSINDLFTMVDELTQQVVDRIGIKIKKQDHIDISDMTTKSIEAYENYIKGTESMYLAYFDDAIKYFEKAIELDSTFASAHLVLGQVYGTVGNEKKRIESLKKAKKFSEGLKGKEKLIIDAMYAAVFEENLEKSLRLIEEGAIEYPDDKLIHYYLGTTYLGIGDSRALKELQHVLELDPDFGPVLNLLIYYNIRPDILDYEKALEYIRRYSEIYPDDANPHDTMGDVFYTMGRIEDAIEKYKEASRIVPGFSEYKIGYMYALLEEYDKCLEWINLSITLEKTNGRKAERYQLRGFINYWLGDYTKAIIDVKTAIENYTEINNTLRVAICNFQLYTLYQEIGDIENSDIHFKQVDEYFNINNTNIDNVFAIVFKILLNIEEFDMNELLSSAGNNSSRIANLKMSRDWALYFYNDIFSKQMIDMGAAKSAIKFYKNKTKIKIQAPKTSINSIFYNFTRKNVLAYAYYKNGDIQNSITEYEKIMKMNPDRNDLRLIHPVYHYGLGLAYEKDGQNFKAIIQYRKFLDFWKNAPQTSDKILDAKERIKKLKEK